MVDGLDTIAAIATPGGVGGIGIVRVSGPEALAVAERVFRRAGRGGPQRGLAFAEVPSHTAHHGYVVDPDGGEVVDEVLALVMRAPRTFTGEEVVELQGHGGPLVLQRVLDAALRAGARPARPGEFTQRAFLHGRLDLAQAEAVLDVIQSHTAGGLRAANEQLMGRLSAPIQALRERLLWLLARLEAAIDYPDEIEDLADAELAGMLADAEAEVQRLLATAAAGRIWREGVPTAIVGRPNVGKSSLLNALLREERAIVTEVPGTTRDAIEELVNVRGVPLRIVDTAGLRDTADVVERIGIERTRRSLAGAALALLVVDAAGPPGEADAGLLAEIGGTPCLLVLNKRDLLPESASPPLPEPLAALPAALISARTGAGLADLEDAIAAAVWRQAGPPDAAGVAINARHQASLARAAEGLARALESARARQPGDFVAIDLKGALLALGEITGETVSEEVIAAIFANFCVGK